jgi:hypothetical protein
VRVRLANLIEQNADYNALTTLKEVKYLLHVEHPKFGIVCLRIAFN